MNSQWGNFSLEQVARMKAQDAVTVCGLRKGCGISGGSFVLLDDQN